MCRLTSLSHSPWVPPRALSCSEFLTLTSHMSHASWASEGCGAPLWTEPAGGLLTRVRAELDRFSMPLLALGVLARCLAVGGGHLPERSPSVVWAL